MNALSSPLSRCTRGREITASARRWRSVFLASARASSVECGIDHVGEGAMRLAIKPRRVALYSMTLGTRYSPASTCGAMLWKVALIAFGDAVLAQAQRDILRMGHRLDAVRIDRLQLFDQGENALQLRQHLVASCFADFDARELSDPCNIVRERFISGSCENGTRLIPQCVRPRGQMRPALPRFSSSRVL